MEDKITKYYLVENKYNKNLVRKITEPIIAYSEENYMEQRVTNETIEDDGIANLLRENSTLKQQREEDNKKIKVRTKMLKDIKREILLYNKGKAYDTADDLIGALKQILEKE